MPDARLEVTDALGRRIVPIAKGQFEIGRRETNDLRLAGSEVSRDHAEIALQDNHFVLRDRNSRYGTYVNGEQVAERTLAHGDRIRLGRTGGAEMVFLLADSPPPVERATTTAIGDLRQIAVLLEGLRALGSGPSAGRRAVAGAGFGDRGERGRARLHHAGAADRRARVQDGAGQGADDAARAAASRPAARSRKKSSAPASRASSPTCSTASSPTCTPAPSRSGIRHVLCVPLRLVRYLDRAEAVGEERRIGVLYLDNREKGTLLSNSTRAALETLATEAAVAIENARLYRETMEKARMEQEMRIAAEIQQALLPKAGRSGVFFKAAAASLPCRSIGGDFYDYVDLSNGSLGFALGDVAGKGPPAALLSAMMQGIFAAQAASSDPPSQTVSRVNLALYRRGIESRFVTLDVRRALSGRAAAVLQRRPQSAAGGRADGLPPARARRADRRAVRGRDLRRGDRHAQRRRLADRLQRRRVRGAVGRGRGVRRGAHPRRACGKNLDMEPQALLESLFADVRDFARGAAQSDDITAMVLRFR